MSNRAAKSATWPARKRHIWGICPWAILLPGKDTSSTLGYDQIIYPRTSRVDFFLKAWSAYILFFNPLKVFNPQKFFNSQKFFNPQKFFNTQKFFHLIKFSNPWTFFNHTLAVVWELLSSRLKLFLLHM